MSFDHVWTFPGAFNKKIAGTGKCGMPEEKDESLIKLGKKLQRLAKDMEEEGFGDCGAGLSRLRAHLMLEELGESIEALGERDLPEFVDGLADLLYVLGGTLDTFHLGKVMGVYFQQVHEANMSKPRSKNPRVRDKGDAWKAPCPKPLLKNLRMIECPEDEQ